MLRFVATLMVVAVLLVNVILWSIYYLNRVIKVFHVNIQKQEQFSGLCS